MYHINRVNAHMLNIVVAQNTVTIIQISKIRRVSGSNLTPTSSHGI